MNFRPTIRNNVYAVVILSAMAVVLGKPLFSAEWRIETVDESGSGRFASLKVDRDGNVHVAYIPEVDGNPLKYAFWDHSLGRWFTMTIAQHASFCTLAIDSKQRPHISYADKGMAKGAKLRYASWDGAAWKTQAVSPANDSIVGYYTSIGLDGQDSPRFSYYDYVGPGGVDNTLHLRSVFWTGSQWEVHLVDRTRGSGKFNSLAVGSDGNPRIAYANVSWETAGLRYTEWDGHTWKTEVVEGLTEPFPVYSVALVLDQNNNPHITYTDVKRRIVKYATRTGGKWQLTAVDSIRAEAYPDRNGIALDNAGNPYLSYYDGGAGILKIAYRKAGKWYVETLDQNGAGLTSSLQINGDTLWVAYADETNGVLKVARRSLKSAPVSSAERNR